MTKIKRHCQDNIEVYHFVPRTKTKGLPIKKKTTGLPIRSAFTNYIGPPFTNYIDLVHQSVIILQITVDH